MSPRALKLLRDLRAESGRVALMVVAIAVSLVAVGTILGSSAILTREIGANYKATTPADATLELGDDVDDAVVQRARAAAGVEDAQARDVVAARVRVGTGWMPMLLFVADDLAAVRINTVRRDSGVWAQAGEVMIERSARAVLGATTGDAVELRIDGAAPVRLPISGTVHDPGLAPAGQERTGYGYITRSTLASLGAQPQLHELRLRFALTDAQGPARMAHSEQSARAVAAALAEAGHPVHQLRVPPPGHPHQRQMATMLLVLSLFAGLALILSALLVATSMAAMLARQVREIGVMKTVGATASKIAALYASLVAAVGIAGVVLALPVALWCARGLATFVAALLNFNVTDPSAPAWVLVAVGMAGVGLPLLMAAVPVVGASRVSVRDAMTSHGASGGAIAQRFARLPAPLRSALRRPARLALTVAVLAAAGATFMAALNVKQSWELNLDKVEQTRHYDLEVQLRGPATPDVLRAAQQTPGVQRVEAWGTGAAAVAHAGQIDLVRTYPDRGHGSLVVMAPPANTLLISFPLRAGQWLNPSDATGAVLSHGAAAQMKGVHVGDPLDVSVQGHVGHFVVRGIVEEVGASGVVYVNPAAFAFTGNDGDALLRLQTTADSADARQQIGRALETALLERGAVVKTISPLSELRAAIGGHIEVLLRLLLAMALVMGTVGALALASTIGIAVVERAREHGVMMAVGATPLRLMRMTVAEAVAIALVSWVTAMAAALPLTAALDGILGNVGFLAPLPWTFSAAAAGTWLLIVVVGAALATLVPASTIGSGSVRTALAHI